MPWPNTDSATRPSAPTNLSGTSSATWYLELAKPALQSEEAAIREPARYVLSGWPCGKSWFFCIPSCLL